MKSLRLLSALVLLFPAAAMAQDVSIAVTAVGTHFDPDVRGQATPSLDIRRSQPGKKTLEVADGSSVRGVFGGLEADLFDWKTRNNEPRPTTLEHLRNARDHDADLFITANVRGLAQPDPANPGKKVFTDTTIPTVTQLAADWVRYTNRIVQKYRVGDKVTDPTDQRILSELRWSTDIPGDQWSPLLNPDEAPVPKVEYWEIGNEPRVGLAKSYNLTNSYTFVAPPREPKESQKTDYADRYKSMTAAMRAEDPEIKVGPCLQGPLKDTWKFSETEGELLDSVLKPQQDGKLLPVDFISYHPYQKMGDVSAPADVTEYLKNVYSVQKNAADRVRERITASGRKSSSVELVASEHFVSYFRYNEQVQEAQMAHALGTTETVFCFARIGLKAAHYWIWPAGNDDGTEYPVFKAYAGMRDHMGDTLLDVYSNGSNRIYTTRDSETREVCVWGMNFENATDATLSISNKGLAGNETITLLRLGARSGATTLTSSNLGSAMPGGPSHDVDWTRTNLTGTNLSDYRYSLPASTLSVLVIQPVAAQKPAATDAAAAPVRRHHKVHKSSP